MNNKYEDRLQECILEKRRNSSWWRLGISLKTYGWLKSCKNWPQGNRCYKIMLNNEKGRRRKKRRLKEGEKKRRTRGEERKRSAREEEEQRKKSRKKRDEKRRKEEKKREENKKRYLGVFWYSMLNTGLLLRVKGKSMSHSLYCKHCSFTLKSKWDTNSSTWFKSFFNPMDKCLACAWIRIILLLMLRA